MGLSRQQYEDRIRARLGDLGVLQRIDEAQIPLALEDAYATYGNDRPREVTQDFAGDGTVYEWDLTTDPLIPFEVDRSRIISVEWPAGAREPTYLDRRFWTIVDGTLRLLSDTPAVGDTIVVRYTTTWPFPTDDPADDLAPARDAQAITARAAATLALNKALEYSRKQSNSVAGDLIQLDAGPLFEAHRILKGIYEETILGRPSDPGEGGAVALGFAVSDVQPIFPNSLFHQRRT